MEKLKTFNGKKGALMPARGQPRKIIALYFRNIPKTERERIGEAIRELLSKRRLLHVSFIGSSVMELLVEKTDSPTILALVRSAGMTYMPYFNVFENSLRNRREAMSQREGQEHGDAQRPGTILRGASE